MNANIFQALFQDSLQQVLDNRVFRLLVILTICMVAPTFLIGFHQDHISLLWYWDYGYNEITATLGVPIPPDVRADEMLIKGNVICDIVDENGEQCGLKFKSLKALHTHQCKTRGQGHGWFCKLRELIEEPICPICHSQFKHRATAIHHVRKAVQKHRCPTDMSRVTKATVDIIQKVK